MGLLAHLDQALGDGVLDRPIVTLDGKRDQTPASQKLYRHTRRLHGRLIYPASFRLLFPSFLTEAWPISN